MSLALSLAFVTAVHVVAAGEASIRIRVYDGAHLDAATREAAIRTADDITSTAGMDVAWNDCAGLRGCDPWRGPRDVMLRILVSAPPDPTHAIGTSGGYVDPTRATLGYAVVDRKTGKGVIGTIFMDRVLEVARRTGVAPGALLGRAMAHEIGHLLLTSGGHDHTGLMRAFWTDEEVQADRTDDWLIAWHGRPDSFSSSQTR